MQEIETIFQRDPNNMRLVLPVRSIKGVDWVFGGEGYATWKWDGSACLVKDGQLYRRYHLKHYKRMPTGWMHWNMEAPEISGHGWLPVGDTPSDEYHQEAWLPAPKDGTYELVGPKVQKNPYKLDAHQLWPHGVKIQDPPDPRDFQSIKEWLRAHSCEGIVWWHPDGRMAKIKRRDFGFPWRDVNPITIDCLVKP